MVGSCLKASGLVMPRPRRAGHAAHPAQGGGGPRVRARLRSARSGGPGRRRHRRGQGGWVLEPSLAALHCLPCARADTSHDGCLQKVACLDSLCPQARPRAAPAARLMLRSLQGRVARAALPPAPSAPWRVVACTLPRGPGPRVGGGKGRALVLILLLRCLVDAFCRIHCLVPALQAAGGAICCTSAGWLHRSLYLQMVRMWHVSTWAPTPRRSCRRRQARRRGRPPPPAAPVSAVGLVGWCRRELFLAGAFASALLNSTAVQCCIDHCSWMLHGTPFSPPPCCSPHARNPTLLQTPAVMILRRRPPSPRRARAMSRLCRCVLLEWWPVAQRQQHAA